MSACERCWADAGGEYEVYLQLLLERHDAPCTPAQQRGDDLPAAPREVGCPRLSPESA